MSRDELRTLPPPPLAEADPFAGDDEPWADEDLAHAWADDARQGRLQHVRFVRAVLLAVAGGAVVWAALGAIVFEIYRLFTG